VYDISVRIAMQNGVSSVLKLIQRDVLGLGAAVDLTQGKFDRMKLAVVGAGVAFAGGAMIKAFSSLAEAGGEVLDQQQRMLANGTSLVDLHKEMATAMNMVAIAGSKYSDNLKLVADLRTVFGVNNLSDALGLAPTMMKAGIAAGLMTGKGAEQSAYDIALIEDRLGYTVNAKTRQMDPQRAAQMANMIDAIISGTNGRVDTQSLLGFAQQALASGKLLSTQGLMDMVPVIQAMGGQKAGTALTAFDKAFVGGVMTTRGTSWLERLGLLNPNSVHKGMSGYAKLDPGAIAGAADMPDPQVWSNQYLLPALKKIVGPNGTLKDMLTVLAQSGLANTTVRFLSDLVGNSVQNAKDVVGIKQAAKISQYDAAMQSLTGAEQNFENAMWGLWQVLGVPAAQTAVKVLNTISTGIRDFTQWVGAHPTYAKIIDDMLIGLGVALTTLGAIAVAGALAGMIGSGGTLALVAAGIIGVATAFTVLYDALPKIEKWFKGWSTSPNNPLNDPSGGVNFVPDAYRVPQRMIKAPQYPATPAAYTVPPPPTRAPQYPVSPAAYNVPTQPGAADLMFVNGALAVHIVNASDLSRATIARLTRDTNAPNTGTTGFNLRAEPSGSAALAI
jgi:hypothetical protein